MIAEPQMLHPGPLASDEKALQLSPENSKLREKLKGLRGK